MKLTIMLLGLLTIQSAFSAPYYRFWRGEKLKQLSETTYVNRLTRDFIPSAPKLFSALNSYLVAVPPKGYGVDEVALLAYSNEAQYLEQRGTAEGRRYSDSHWELFERETSKSLVPQILDEKIEANKAYDLLNTIGKWNDGVTFFFMGQKKPGLSTAAYLAGLDQHVRRVRRLFAPLGMTGYVVLVTEDREYAWINWASAEQANKVYTSAFGKSVMAEAAGLMDIIQWNLASNFTNKLARGNAVKVNTLRPDILIDAH